MVALYCFNLAQFYIRSSSGQGLQFLYILANIFCFFYFCFVVFHEVLYHCNVDMFPRLVILRLYQVPFGHLCIIFFGETCIQVFLPPLPALFWPCCVECKIFVPQAGIKPA